MIAVIDNYDSFTYNLVQYLGTLGAEVTVRRNDEVTVKELAAMKPDGLLISPGPGEPRDAGISEDARRGSCTARRARSCTGGAGSSPGSTTRSRPRAITRSSSSANRCRTCSRSWRGRRRTNSWG